MSEILKKSVKIIRDEGMISFIKKVASRILEPFLIPYAIYKLQKEKENINKLEDFVDLAFNFKACGLNIVPSQIRKEITKLLKILQKLKPRNILEIGTAKGGTLFLFSQIADPCAKIISIDLPGGKFGGGYSKWKIPLYKSFASNKQKIYLIRDDSHKKQSLEKIKRILNGEKLDFLFIDGDHTYEGVRKDFEMYGSLVKKDGIVAFHDIVPGSKEYVGGVPKFWKEIKKKYKHKEIVKDWKQKGFGIGVIYYR